MIKLVPTPHAVQRARTRTGWCRQTLERMLDRVYYFGLCPEDCGRRLGDYLESVRTMELARFARLYGEHVFIFGREGPEDEVSLITILHLPAEYRPLAQRARARSLEVAA